MYYMNNIITKNNTPPGICVYDMGVRSLRLQDTNFIGANFLFQSAV